MKKIYLNLASCFLGSMTLLFAQAPISDIDPSFGHESIDPIAKNAPVGTPGTAGPNDRWLSYALSKYWAIGKPASQTNPNGLDGQHVRRFWMSVFPDTTVFIPNTYFSAPTAHFRPRMTSVAFQLDPTAAVFNNNPFENTAGELSIRDGDVFNLDSIAFPFFYKRNNTSVTDTLRITVATGGGTSTFWSVFGAANASFLAQYQVRSGSDADTIRFLNVPYNKDQKRVDSIPEVITIDYLLDNTSYADSNSLYFYYKEFRVNNLLSNNGQIPVGRLPVVGVTFVPGYSYSANDSLDGKQNFFATFFWEEYGPTAANPSAAEEVPRYYKNDWNMGYFANHEVRYDNAGQFNGAFLPTVVFGPTFSTENWDIYFKVSCASGCDVISTGKIAGNKFSLGQAFPNPANAGESVTIPVNLEIPSDDLELKIYNSIGQEVSSIKNKEFDAGRNEVSVNTAALRAGVYLYSLEVDDKIVATKRFTLVK